MNSIGVTLEQILSHCPQPNGKETISSIIVVPAGVLRLKKSEVLEIKCEEFSCIYDTENGNHCKSECFQETSSSEYNLKRCFTF